MLYIVEDLLIWQGDVKGSRTGFPLSEESRGKTDFLKDREERGNCVSSEGNS